MPPPNRTADLDHPGFDVGPHEDQVTAVCLHGRAHEVHDPLQLGQALRSLGVAQLGGGVGLGHAPILPCTAADVTTG